MTTSGSQGAARKRAVLSRDLSEFLIELSIAVHRYAMYPPDHPSVRPAVENVIAGLTSLLQERPALSIGVARRQLLIEGVATDERHPVLSDLARRMHAHRLGGVTFSRGATLDQIGEAVAALARDPERETRPIGLLPDGGRPSWEHVQLVPAGYDRLEVDEAGLEESGPRRLQLLWIGLAKAALEAGELEDGEVPTGRPLARIIEGHAREADYDQVIVEYLLHLSEELNRADGPESAAIREEVSNLLDDVDEHVLGQILKLGAGAADRKALIKQANRGGLGVDSVIKLLHAAARADGQTISSSLSRLLGKLAAHAGPAAATQRVASESALRETVEGLISDWDLDDPNPDAYTELLDRMAVGVPEFEASEPGDVEDRVSGSERILKMALETDSSGPIVRRAASGLLEAGEVGRVLELLDGAPSDSEVASELRSFLVTPGQLARLLAGDDVDEQGLRLLVDRIGPGAVEPLYEALRESESRAIRRKIFDVLSRMGDDVARLAVESLSDERWFVKRNMLALLQKLDTLPDGFSAQEFVRHDDARVRREAFPLAFRTPDDRDRALASALADTDERIVRMALLELQGAIPETVVPVVVNRVLQTDAFPALRGLAVRAVRNAKSPLARQALLQVCSDGRSLLGRPRLAPGTPDVIAAISALAENWEDDRDAARLLAAAKASKDARIRQTVQAASAAAGGAS